MYMVTDEMFASVCRWCSVYDDSANVVYSLFTGVDQVLYQDRQLQQQVHDQELQQRLFVTWDCLIQQGLNQGYTL